MDKRLQIVEHLYGEEDDAVSLRELIGESEELRREHRAMSKVKFWLDHRAKQRPDGAVIDRVVAAAAQAAPEPARRPMARIIPMRYAVAASVVAVAIAIGIWTTMPSADSSRLLFQTEQTEQDGASGNPLAESEESLAQTPSDTPDESGFAGRAPDAAVAKDELLADRVTPVRPQVRVVPEASGDRDVSPELAESNRPREFAVSRTTVAGRMDSAGAGLYRVGTRSLTDWDAADDMIRLRRRIDHLQARNRVPGWDNAAVPLEMMPVDATADPNGVVLRRAGSTQRP